MGFSRAQQPEFRQMVTAAWGAHCRAESVDAKSPAKRAWYEAELFEATGQYSSVECGAGRDYDRAMAHFEALSGSGIRWQMKLYSGDAVRILHNLREVCADHDISEEYLRGVARRSLRREDLPDLHLLTREHLVMILGEVKRYIRRRLKTDAKAGVPQKVEEPF